MTPNKRGEPYHKGHRSLGQKYSIFTGLLLSYIVFVFVAFDIWAGTFHPMKASVLAIATLLIAGAIAKYTNRVLERPLRYLQQGMADVREGRLQPIQVSRTGDEVEFVGESFNAMIHDLAASRAELQQYHESLEELVRQRTRDLENVSKRALAASQAKSEFLANVSHELRTPMAGILGMIDIALDSDLDSDQREQLVTAKGCANTLLALLNDILDLSKIEAGRMILEDIPFDLPALVNECVKSLQPRAEQKGIVLRCEIAPDVPQGVSGDPLRVRQILSNLLSNAVKFTEKGSVDMRVSVGATYGEQPLLVLEVSDTGPGISPEMQASIFDQFTQADGSISRRYGGTGLGLAITRKLLELQNGRILLSSEVGKGSTFRVEVPYRPVSVAQPRDRTEPGLPASAEANNGEPDTILVVEDNLVNQKVITAMLRRHGFRVVIANHGGEALKVLQSEPITLVLMDVQMPEVDGLEATRIIRRDPKWQDLPIIAMTARAMNGDRDLCLREGMNGYLSKPVNRTQLIAAVEKHIIDRTHPVNGHSHNALSAVKAS